MATGDTAVTPSAPAKRALFSKRPAWAALTQAPKPDSPATDVFTRSSQSYSDILKQQEERKRREREKIKQRAAREERRKSERRDSVEDSASKRRRISDDTYARYGLESPNTEQDAAKGSFSDEDPNEEFVAQAIAKKKAGNSGDAQTVDEANTDKVQRSSRSPKQRSPPSIKRKVPHPKQIISLSDDDDDDAPPARPTRTTSPPALESDEEFPELAALARERRRKQVAEARNGKTQPTARPRPTTMATVATLRSQGAAAAKPPRDPPAPAFDPVIKVLVTSPLSNTKPLLVHRKLSQRLLEIRKVWCERQGFNDEQMNAVFLVYKMRRLYDVTTCKSLGIKVDSAGRVVGEGQTGERDVFATARGLGDDDEGEEREDDASRVHVIAVTEEVFAEMRNRREDERLGRGRTAEGSTAVQNEEVAVEQQPEDNKKVRLILRAKGYKDYKLIVRPTTLFEKIISAFKRENKLADDADVVLTFDGERLEPEDDIQSADIEDMDGIEVYVR